MPHATQAVTEIVELLERYEPETFDEAFELPLPPTRAGRELEAAWEIYHHNRGRGWN
jgi:hypothetical protein